MDENIVPRIGTFFIIIGVGFLILFTASDLANQTYFDYFFLGLIIVAVGSLLRRKAPPPPPSGRFSIIRKMRERKQQKAEQKPKEK